MASREYMDLFVVESMKCAMRFLAQAPWMSHIEEGDRVVVKVNDTEQRVEVIAKTDIRKDDDEIISFLKCLDGHIKKDEDIPKITTILREVEVEYDE